MRIYCFRAVLFARLHAWETAEHDSAGQKSRKTKLTPKKKVDAHWCKDLQISQASLDRLLGRCHLRSFFDRMGTHFLSFKLLVIWCIATPFFVSWRRCLFRATFLTVLFRFSDCLDHP